MQTGARPATGSDRRRAERIDQVLEAAIGCFVEFGFHGAGMSKIAKRARMSVGHIYHYFESKEAIIAAIVERESEAAAERFAELQSVPDEDLARMMTERMEETIATKTDSFQSVLNLEILAECQRNPEIACIVRRHDEEVRGMMVEILRTKLGLSDAEARAEVLLSLFAGLGARVLRHPGLDRHSLQPLYRDMLHSLLEPDMAGSAAAD